MDWIPLKTIFQVIGAGSTGQMHFLSPINSIKALNGTKLVELFHSNQRFICEISPVGVGC